MNPRLLSPQWLIVPALLGGLTLPAQAVPAASEAVGTSACPATTQPVSTVTGRVVDEKGAGLPGVTILVKGSTLGTTTGSDGRFTLDLPATITNPVLRLSFVGYLAQDVEVGSRTEFNVTMKEDAEKLKEVVVIGYGEQSRKVVSTAISSIDGEVVGRQPVGTPGESLAALAPGVVVQSDRGGTPGAAPAIVIRGGTSLGTSADPLYVVDGYPLQDAAQFNAISPGDIASIEVLKDAASSAIYGARAANGVIIVTTKRGQAGKTVFRLSAYTGLQHITKRLNTLNRDEYIQSVRDGARIRAYPNTPNPTVFDVPGLDISSLADTDWQDQIYRTAKITDLQLSASGGTEKARFAVSGGYFNQDGVLKGTAYERFSMRFNLDANLVPTLKVGVSISPTYAVQDRQAAAGQYAGSNGSENGGTRAVPSVTGVAGLMPPTIPVFRPNGDYGQGYNAPERAPNGSVFYTSNLFNPVAVVDLNENRLRNYRLFGNSYLEWEPIAGLKLKTTGGATLNLDQQHAYIPATLATEAAAQANLSTPVIGSIFGRESQATGVDFLWENTATYAKSIGGHNFTVLGLYSLQKFQLRSTATAGKPSSFANTFLDNPISSTDRVGELGFDKNAFESMAARLLYDYKKKYILSAAIRRDGSSRFGKNNPYGYFPSGSLAWRVSEEAFFGGVKNVVNEFKLRASIGLTGNANIGSFTYLNNVAGSNYSFGGTRAIGYVQSGLANPDLTWEKNRQTDLGADLGFLGDKLVLSLDYYDRLTTGMLQNRDLPGLVGYATSYRTNVGKLQNRGLEAALTTNLKIGAVRWTITGNISGNRSKVLDLGGPAFFAPEAANFGWNNVYQVRVGDPLGNMYGFKVLGIFKNAEDLANNAQTGTLTAKGDKIGNWIIQDTNGDGVINESDRTLLGNGTPKYTYGLSQTVAFKGFDLGVILQGVQGIDVINGNLRHLWGTGGPFNTIHDIYDNIFDPANPTDARYPQVAASGINPGNQFTDRTLFSGSFLRVRNATLGYTFASALLRQVKLQSVRLYLTGQNLYTFTSYPGLNPEVSINGGVGGATNAGLTRPGLDQSTYPASRTYTVGMNVSF